METGSASRPQHHSVKPALHRDCLCHIKASAGLAGREAKEPPAGLSTATHTRHIHEHADHILHPTPICLHYGHKAGSFHPVFYLTAVSLWCVFWPWKGCIDEPSLTFNEASSDELALESYCLLLPQSANKVLMGTFPQFVPKTLSFLTASQIESIQKFCHFQ